MTPPFSDASARLLDVFADPTSELPRERVPLKQPRSTCAAAQALRTVPIAHAGVLLHCTVSVLSLPDIDVSLIAELIQAGADPNYVFPGLQTTPLLDAINTGKPAIVQELLSANALVYDGNSSEPLMLATFTSQPNAAIIKMIADAGTDLIPTSLLTVRPSSSSHSLSLSLVRLTHFSLSIDCTSVIDRVKETRSQAISRSSMVLDRKGCQHRAAQGSRESSR